MNYDELLEAIQNQYMTLPGIKWTPERLKNWADGYIACKEDVIELITRQKEKEQRK